MTMSISNLDEIRAFIMKKYPACKRNMNADILDNFSGNELVELIAEFMAEQ